MPKVYRKKTDLEIALSPFISAVGRMPTPKELSRSLGGDPSDWGRILKRQQKIAGEYHARLKLLDDGSEIFHAFSNILFKRQAIEASKKYAEKTRKGRIVPHVKDVFNDMYNYNLEKMIEERMGRCSYDDYDYYITCGERIYEEGLQYPTDAFEEQTLRREFINSLS